jgi:hypothetical protein
VLNTAASRVAGNSPAGYGGGGNEAARLAGCRLMIVIPIPRDSD